MRRKGVRGKGKGGLATGLVVAGVMMVEARRFDQKGGVKLVAV